MNDRVMDPGTIVVRRVAADDIRALRHAVLRPGLPFDATRFEGDELDTTIHLAALVGTAVVGCASWMLSVFADEPALQLRGMAVDPAWQGSGIGGRLLRHSEELFRDSPITLRWCNARTSAVGFYERQGWTVVSPVFDIPTAGPHCRMTKRRPA